ncbi:MAG: MarR family transcriptional regulator [Eubacterium sp.]|nr:MarR family transcriptional regulator [Eubacterium sp.]
MDIQECVNYLLTGAQHRVFQDMKNALKKYDLTPIQYGVLQCMWQMDMSNPKEIAEFHGVENSTMSGILDRMETKGLIKREIDEKDRRFIKIRQTDISKSLEEPVVKTVEEVNFREMGRFSHAEADQFKEYLRRISKD